MISGSKDEAGRVVKITGPGVITTGVGGRSNRDRLCVTKSQGRRISEENHVAKGSYVDLDKFSANLLIISTIRSFAFSSPNQSTGIFSNP